MNHNELAHRLSTLSACVLAAAFCFMTAAASAQTASAGSTQGGTSNTAAPAVDDAAAKPTTQTQAVVEEEEETYKLSLQVGDATSNLFAWQRSGEVASKTARPIAGSVAGRSYERYLKSFEHPIPEHMSSTVRTSTGGGGTK